MKKLYLLVIISIFLGLILIGGQCPTTPPTPTPTPTPSGTGPTALSISIENGAEKTNDTTPNITVSASGAISMAFSGNGRNWTDWIPYSPTYDLFNITLDAGCTIGDGEKIVYVKFKDSTGGVSEIISDTITLDTTPPQLASVFWTDTNKNEAIDANDILVFTFTEAMNTATITSSDVDARFTLDPAHSFGSTVAWNSAKTACSVTLGSSETIVGGESVTPTASIKDEAGNGANTTISQNIPTPTATRITSAVYADQNANSNVDTGDTITVTFNKSLDSTTLSTTTATSDFSLYHVSTAYTWSGISAFLDTDHKIVKITLGSSIPGFTTGTDTIKVLADALKDSGGASVATDPAVVY